VTTVTSTRAGRRAGAAATALLALVLAGCGGDESADPGCLSQAYNAAEAAAVADLYERGELGSETKVRAELEHHDMRFFDDQGRMIPYDELSRAEQNQLVAWFSNGPVGRATESDRERAVDQADPDC
jgi:hypothetical protein